MSQITDSFFVTLCSNVANRNYENSISNFVTELPSPLHLDSSWRVGLSEIHFVNSWLNLRSWNRIKITDVEGSDYDTKYCSFTALPPGRYDDIDVLTQEIRDRIKSSATSHVPIKPDIYANPFSQRVKISYGRNTEMKPLTVTLDPELRDMLGLSQPLESNLLHDIVTLDREVITVNPTVSESDEFVASRSYDLSGGIHSLFVYSDVVDYSIVGNVRAQLLRIAHVSAPGFGASVVNCYENPYYLPLATKEISSIEVHIKDDQDRSIPFEFGRVKIVLHFVRNGGILS